MPYHHFTPHEQSIIAHMTSARFSQRDIGRRLGRHHASIGREIRRNRPTYAADAVYWYDAAEYYAKERCHRPRHRRRQHERLVSYVTSRLRLDWSPEAIAGRLNVDYPDDGSMRMCHETIYRWIYEDSRSKGDLHCHLRRGHKYRRRQKRYGSGRRFMPDRVSIDLRPSVVATRERFGDWEGDTVEGGKGGEFQFKVHRSAHLPAYHVGGLPLDFEKTALSLRGLRGGVGGTCVCQSNIEPAVAA